MKEAQVIMRQAIDELKVAENYFENAKTQDEIDYAVYRLNAARAKIDLISRGELN